MLRNAKRLNFPNFSTGKIAILSTLWRVAKGVCVTRDEGKNKCVCVITRSSKATYKTYVASEFVIPLLSSLMVLLFPVPGVVKTGKFIFIKDWTMERY